MIELQGGIQHDPQSAEDVRWLASVVNARRIARDKKSYFRSPNVNILKTSVDQNNVYAPPKKWVNSFNSVITLTDTLPMTLFYAHDIIVVTAQVANIPHDRLISVLRDRKLAAWRHAGIYLCCMLTELSFNQIGKVCGKRDHSTLMYAFHKVRSNPDIYWPKIKAILDELCRG